MLELLADAPTDLNQLSGWVSLITTGGFGVLAWYLIAKVIPKQTEDFRTDVKLLTDTHKAALKDLHTECREERIEQRREYLDATKRQNDESISRLVAILEEIKKK